MKKWPLPYPMKKSEKIFGWLYLPLHMFLLGNLIYIFYINVLRPNGIELTDPEINAVFYGFGFVMITIFMFRFLKSSFYDLCDNKLNTVKSVIFGYIIYYAMLYVVSLILMFVLKGEISNPNNNAVSDLAKLNPNTMMAVAVLLAPFVEEALFRGIVFGSIRNKSRILAYVVSTLIFSVYHLWSYFTTGFDWSVLIYLLQYIPGSVALAWCYEHSRNIWGSVLLHMIINFVSLKIIIG